LDVGLLVVIGGGSSRKAEKNEKSVKGKRYNGEDIKAGWKRAR